jgi:valyl-tRNA synthetase
VKKKTGNERFMNSAPAQVVELERKKQTDAEEKIKMLGERLVSFKSSMN